MKDVEGERDGKIITDLPVITNLAGGHDLGRGLMTHRARDNYYSYYHYRCTIGVC